MTGTRATGHHVTSGGVGSGHFLYNVYSSVSRAGGREAYPRFECGLLSFFRKTDLMFVCLFVFVALRPKSTAMVIAGRSVYLTTLFSWASLNEQLTSNRAHTFACN